MIDIRHLINFLPFYYKDKDTEKVNDKGILERFLEICGDYFTDNIKATIDNSLELLNIETTSQEYLSWLWDLLGQIPFARKPLVAPLNLTVEQQRYLIKYSNELLKIRGTKEFFEIMFKIYSNSSNNLNLISIESEDFGWEKDFKNNSDIIQPYFDMLDFDNNIAKFDEYYNLKQCIKVTFNITCSNNSESFQKAIKAFIERFVPFNVSPVIIINGIDTSETYSLVLEVYEQGKWVIPKNYAVELVYGQIIKARVSAVNSQGDRVDGIRFLSHLNGGDYIERVSPYNFYITSVIDKDLQDEYEFILGSDIKRLTVNTQEVKLPTYTLTIDKSEAQLLPTLKNIEVVITAYSTIEGQSKPVQVICEQTGEVKTTSSQDFTSKWSFTNPGTYTFIISGNSSNKVTLVVKNYTRNYQVRLAKAVWNSDEQAYVPDGDYTDNLSIVCTNPNTERFIPQITSNDSSLTQAEIDQLTCHMVGSLTPTYKNGSVQIVKGFGTWEFTPSIEASGNANAILNVTSDNVSFLLEKYVKTGETETGDVLDEKQTSVKLSLMALAQTTAAQDIIDKQTLAFVLKLPGGSSQVIPYNTTYNGDGVKVSWEDLNIITITVETPGSYVIDIQQDTSAVYTWNVTENKPISVEFNGLVIEAIDEDDPAWTGSRTNNAIYQLSENEDTEAVFRILGWYKEGDDDIYSEDLLNEIEANDGNHYMPGEEYTITTPKTVEFTVVDNNKTYKATLEVRDFQTIVELRCAPSASVLGDDGKASTKLYITCNRSTAKLQVKLESTGDLYEDGDVFSANKPGVYNFIAMINGEEFKDSEGNLVQTTFNVIDPNDIDVDPLYIVFDHEGNVVEGSDTIQITAYEDTEWELVIQN